MASGRPPIAPGCTRAIAQPAHAAISAPQIGSATSDDAGDTHLVHFLANRDVRQIWANR